MPILDSAGKLIDKISPRSDEDKKIRSGLIKVGGQLDSTREILKLNKEKLLELAKNDKDVAELIKNFIDQDPTEEIRSKISKGRTVSGREGKKLIGELQKITGELEKVKVSLDIPVATVADNVSKMIENENIGREDRREMVSEMQQFFSDPKIKEGILSDGPTIVAQKQLDAIEKLVSINAKSLNFNQEDSNMLNGIFKELKDDDLMTARQTATLNDLNKSIAASTLNQEELNEFLQKESDGKSIKERLEEGLKSTLTGGILDTLLAPFGLDTGLLGGAFDLARGGLRRAGKTRAGRGVGRVGRKVGGKVAGAATGLLGGLGKGARLLGKAALPIAAVMSVFDFAKGFGNAADIAGLKPGEEASFGTKVQAGISSVVEGLTFGLVDAKDAFQFFDGAIMKVKEFASWAAEKAIGIRDFFAEGFNNIFGGEGFLGMTGNVLKTIWSITPFGLVMNNLESIRDFFGKVFGEEGLMVAMKDVFRAIGEKVLGFVDKIRNFDFTSLLPDSVAKFFSDDDEEEEGSSKIAGKAKEEESGFFSGLFGGGTESTASDQTKASFGSGATVGPGAGGIDGEQSLRAVNKEAENERLAAAAQQKPVVIDNSRTTVIERKAPARVSRIDDMGLESVNRGDI